MPLLVGGAALLREVHQDQDRAGLRRSRLLRQGRHDRAAADERTHGSGRARSRCSRRTRIPGSRPARRYPRRRRARVAHTARSPKVRTDVPIPPAPYLDRKIRDVPQLAEVWSYINPFMLYGRHLGYKGNFEKRLAERDPKALELFHKMEEVKQDAAQFMKVRAVWQFFEAERDGNCHPPVRPRRRLADSHLPIRTPGTRERPLPERLCARSDDGRRDHIALFVVTAGAGIREASEECEAGGRLLQGARACRRWPSKPPRAAPNGCTAASARTGASPILPPLTMQERFTSRYRGKRYSFGYPACPNLDDQQGIWKLLRPEEIGVNSPKA